MRHLFLATLSVFVVSCTPTLGGTADVFVNQTFASGQRWTVAAVGGDGTETISLVLSDRRALPGSGAVTFSNAIKNPESSLTYAPSTAQHPVEDITVIWNRPDNVDGFCVFRNPSAAEGRTVFQGRYARSFERAQDYLRSGTTTGTGTCSLKREQ